MKSAETYISHFAGERSEKIGKAIHTLKNLIAFYESVEKLSPTKVTKYQKVKQLLTQVQKL